MNHGLYLMLLICLYGSWAELNHS